MRITGRLKRLLPVAGVLWAFGAWAPAAHAGYDTRLPVDGYSDEYDDLFRHYAKRYFGPFEDWRWFKAQAVAESTLDPKATGVHGARGLMQVMPTTYEHLRKKQPQLGSIEDPRSNIAAGILYSREMFQLWDGKAADNERLYLALASYNAGYGRVLGAYKRSGHPERWDSVKRHAPPITRGYLNRIRKLMSAAEEVEFAGLETSGERVATVQ